MNISPLKVIPAGAGSGKTYTIQKTLGEWISKGFIQPDRIVAVTFTETAATELKQRISAELIANNDLDGARKLDQSYISTIHGFGMRLVTEFAFDAGIAPSPRLLNEDEQKEIIKKALSNTTRAETVIRSLESFGYKFDYTSKKSAEDYFRNSVLNAVNLLRSLGWSSECKSLVGAAKDWLVKETAEVNKDANKLNKRLNEAVISLLDKFPHSLVEEFGVSKAAKEGFTNDFSNLMRAKDIGQIEKDWALWRSLQELRTKARGTKLPDEYISLAEDVIEAAQSLHVHPGPLDHELTHISCMLGAAEEVLERYGASKVAAGLVDYTDMVAKAGDLLGQSVPVFEALKQRVDCVIVDEFQDTNPLQFSLIWLLASAGIPTLIVGDVKQAIMGFQGADPRLFESVQDRNPSVLEPLDKNWRTQLPLMNFLNDVSAGLFVDHYQRLTPMVEPTDLKPLMVVEFDSKVEKGIKKPLWYASHIAQQVYELLNSPNAKVKDRQHGNMRRLVASDIAVLAPTHGLLATYRDVLAGYGIRANLQQGGWYESRVVQLMIAALAWLDDETDNHAALYLCVTELGSLSLEEGLKFFVGDESLEDEVLETLKNSRMGINDLSVPDVLGRVIVDLDIYSRLLNWPDAEQSRANLLRLQDESYEFVMMHKETLASGGFYGSGVQTFLSWLKSRVDEDDKQPAPFVVDEDAVVLKTWHASKGLEWPVVVVAGMHKQVKASLPNLSVGYQSFDDLTQIVKQANIEFSPDFDDLENKEEFMAPLLENAIKESHRLLYVALTRAREKLILEWPSNLELSTAKLPHYWRILRDASQLHLGLDSIVVGDTAHACEIIKTGTAYPQSYDPNITSVNEQRKTIGRVALVESGYLGDLTPSFLSPSMLENDADNLMNELSTQSYGGGLDLDLGLSASEYGDFIHRCIECLLEGCCLNIKDGELFGVACNEELESKIVSWANDFKSYLNAEYPKGNLLTEVPVIGLDKNASVMTGVVDLLIETEEGIWIIDHKSDSTGDMDASFAKHLPQLLAYKDILATGDTRKILGIGINWVRLGQMTAMCL